MKQKGRDKFSDLGLNGKIIFQ